jgi:hypothetical protein
MAGEVLNERALGSVCIQEEAAEQSLITEKGRHNNTMQPASSQPKHSRGAVVNKAVLQRAP